MRIHRIGSVTAIFTLSTGISQADEAGSAWLQRIDAAARVDDAHLVLDVTVYDGKGGSSPRQLEVWQKGDDRRLVRIAEPARLKGVGLLVTEGDTIHLFLPQYPPARRVVGSKRADAFIGTDFSVDDLSRMRFADRYDAVVEGIEGDLHHLVLTPRDDSGDTRVDVWVADDAVVRRVDHTDARGRVTRRLELSEIRPEGSVLLAHQMRVSDLLHDRRTEARVVQVETQTGLSPDLFTVASLERP